VSATWFFLRSLALYKFYLYLYLCCFATWTFRTFRHFNTRMFCYLPGRFSTWIFHTFRHFNTRMFCYLRWRFATWTFHTFRHFNTRMFRYLSGLKSYLFSHAFTVSSLHATAAWFFLRSLALYKFYLYLCCFATWTFRTFRHFNTRMFCYLTRCFATCLKVCSGGETSRDVAKHSIEMSKGVKCPGCKKCPGSEASR